MRPAFKQDGTTTLGNSSQVADGAAAVLLAKRSYAEKNGLPILGRFLAFSANGVPPDYMGIGPVVAIPAALKKCGLAVRDIDIFEINEAFASQVAMTADTLSIPREKINPRGGAIALGHPIGMSGARMIVSLFNEMERTQAKLGLVSMCIGTGMGACGVFERE